MQQLELDAVLDYVALNNESFVTWARGYAQSYSLLHGVVTIDEVRQAAETYGLAPDSEKSWGCIFRKKGWQYIGMQRSTHQSNHHRRVCMWKWEG